MLAVIAAVCAVAVPPFQRRLDRLAVAAAARTLLAACDRARMAGLESGGAELVVDASAGRVWVEATVIASPDTLPLGDVAVDVSGASPVRIRYSALGLGVVASRTFVLHRGSAQARVTLSGYGRARVW